jgi:hypothetical protein
MNQTLKAGCIGALIGLVVGGAAVFLTHSYWHPDNSPVKIDTLATITPDTISARAMTAYRKYVLDSLRAVYGLPVYVELTSTDTLTRFDTLKGDTIRIVETRIFPCPDKSFPFEDSITLPEAAKTAEYLKLSGYADFENGILVGQRYDFLGRHDGAPSGNPLDIIPGHKSLSIFTTAAYQLSDKNLEAEIEAALRISDFQISGAGRVSTATGSSIWVKARYYIWEGL